MKIQVPTLTPVLIAACVAVAFRTSLGDDRTALAPLFITGRGHTLLQEIAAGEVWRLLTPIFIHFGPVHLLFNMMWLWDLGREIEKRNSPWFLAGFVALVGIGANIAQYVASGPAFGGMSGVVYGLLAYIWVRNRLDPNAGYVLHQYDVLTCMGWYVLCWTGALGPIANWAHTAGLIGGLAWGYLETMLVGARGGLPRRPQFVPQPEAPQKAAQSSQQTSVVRRFFSDSLVISLAVLAGLVALLLLLRQN
jgi:membrane associated rhomboid family serine protease